MPRHRVNINEPGHAHELTFSCYHRFPFLKAERSCQWLVEAIEQARHHLEFSVWAYVFMPDHAHLIVYPRRKEYDIAEIRHAIKAPVGRHAIAYLEEHAPEWLPRITRQRGQRTERLFWQSGGGDDQNIITRRALLSMIDYLHENPVRKQWVLRARDWRWSSAAWYDDLSAVPLIPNRIPYDWLE
jgi:putative transposase